MSLERELSEEEFELACQEKILLLEQKYLVLIKNCNYQLRTVASTCEQITQNIKELEASMKKYTNNSIKPIPDNVVYLSSRQETI